MDLTSNFFIMTISIFLYFFLIGLVYIKVVNPQYPINWALVMKFMLGLNHYDDVNIKDDEKFTTISNQTPGKLEGFSNRIGNTIQSAASSSIYRFSKNVGWWVSWISIRINQLMVKLYIRNNTFYSTQRINARPLISL